jgi:hypothetical protein
MANILVFDLQPAGSGLFASSESLLNSMTDLSENELKTAQGGKKSRKYGSGYGYRGSGRGYRGSGRGYRGSGRGYYYGYHYC